METAHTGVGLWAAFGQSNAAGQCIVGVLGALSLLAWTIMTFKYLELKSQKKQNERVHRAFRLAVDTGRWPGPVEKGAPHAFLLDAVMPLGRKTYPSEAARVRELENTLEAALGAQLLSYESQMSLLSTLTTGAPLLGLLGTVWGVMEAFGSVAHEQHVTLQSLAPGVSGALLTTVAGLLVALPCVFGYNTLVAHVRRMNADLEAFAGELHTFFSSTTLNDLFEHPAQEATQLNDPVLA